MQRNKYLAGRLREVLLNGTWVANVNFKKHIENLNYVEATSKFGTLNTIADLTFHLNYYLAGVINVFEGGGLEIRDQYSFDLSPIQSEEQWQSLMTTFLNNAEKFAIFLEGFDDKLFDENFVDPKYGSLLRNVDGMIEHCYYHLGQVTIIKKMMNEMKGD